MLQVHEIFKVLEWIVVGCLPFLLIDLLARFLKPRSWPQRILDTLIVMGGMALVIKSVIHPIFGPWLPQLIPSRSLRCFCWMCIPILIGMPAFKWRKRYIIVFLSI
ncbi:MAG: hypothetical protein LBH38_04455, partial [Holosporales bacterium]|nr:hypothetical protein [Holosporales bacterium]